MLLKAEALRPVVRAAAGPRQHLREIRSGLQRQQKKLCKRPQTTGGQHHQEIRPPKKAQIATAYRHELPEELHSEPRRPPRLKLPAVKHQPRTRITLRTQPHKYKHHYNEVSSNLSITDLLARNLENLKVEERKGEVHYCFQEKDSTEMNQTVNRNLETLKKNQEGLLLQSHKVLDEFHKKMAQFKK